MRASSKYQFFRASNLTCQSSYLFRLTRSNGTSKQDGKQGLAILSVCYGLHVPLDERRPLGYESAAALTVPRQIKKTDQET
jgi:hypothetical protein